MQIVDVVANTVFAKYNYDNSHLYNISKVHMIHEIRFPYKKFGLDNVEELGLTKIKT